MKFLEGLDCRPYIDYEPVWDDQTDQQDRHITGVKIKKVRLESIVETVYQQLEPNNNLLKSHIKMVFDSLDPTLQRQLASHMLIYRYCIHRILTIGEIYKPDVWSYYAERDYYGVEIGTIFLNPELAMSLDTMITQLERASCPGPHGPDAKRLEQVLKHEYGHLLDSVRDQQWTVRVVDFDKIYAEYFKKCKEEERPEYLTDYHLPLAIVLCKDDGTFKVIDGYHRLAGRSDDRVLVICNVPQ